MTWSAPQNTKPFFRNSIIGHGLQAVSFFIYRRYSQNVQMVGPGQYCNKTAE